MWTRPLCLLLVLGTGALAWRVDNIRNEVAPLADDLRQYFATGERSELLERTFELMRLRTPWKGANPKFDPLLFDILPPGQREPVTCALCEVLVNEVFDLIDTGATREELINRAVNICLTLNIQTEEVCTGMVESNVDIVMFIYQNRELLAADVCGMAMFPSCPLENPIYNWSVDLSTAGPKPPIQTPELPPEGVPTFKVLHISDLHLDLLYAPGSNAECVEPTCCRTALGPPATPEAAAGYWGDYRDCDTPWHSFVEMIEHIKATHPDIEYAVFTGDTPDHVVWNTSVEYNTELFSSAFREMERVLGVPVYGIMGNHEPHPLNQFVEEDASIPYNLSSKWLYELAWNSWMPWLPAEAQATLIRGGFYSVQAHDDLWVIGINNNFCYNYNFWSLYDNVDPGDQISWLIDTLTQIEAQGGKAHILAHIPPGGGSCTTSWAREFKLVLDRFEATITAQFNGHSHSDQFFIYYDTDDLSRPTGVAFIPGSMTPYSELNPSYRVYAVEGTHATTQYRVLDHENWYYNLTEANLAGPDVLPNWQRLYSFNEEFGTKALVPTEMDQLLHRMVADPTLVDKYYRFHVSNTDIGLAEGCDEGCQRGMLCRITETLEADLRKCDELFPPPTDPATL